MIRDAADNAVRNAPGHPAPKQGYPPMASLTHVGLTVLGVRAVMDWYVDILGFEVVLPPQKNIHNGSLAGDVVKDMFGDGFEGLETCMLRSANGACLELIRFITPASEQREDKFEYWRTGLFHICVAERDIDALITRILDAGGKQISAVWPLYKDQPYRAAYCADPWGNILEVFSHDTVETFANQA